mmetsp:Transcript_20195/g.51437  ORF Transcript_20195/g.51437 Transcript_20195/m.51437 type:complete len:313 (+) Transcript_20195:2-940(+)
MNSYNALLAAGHRWNASSCLTPWAAVEEGVPPAGHSSSALERDGYRPSIMKALTQHNPRVCLAEDDLEALNVLYPDCATSVTLPVCYKTAHNIGWVRFFVWTVCPVLLMLIFLVALSSYLRKFQLRRYESAVSIAQEREKSLARAAKANAHLTRSLQSAEESKAAAESRVDKLRAQVAAALGMRRTSVQHAGRRSHADADGAGGEPSLGDTFKRKCALSRVRQLLTPGRRTSMAEQPQRTTTFSKAPSNYPLAASLPRGAARSEADASTSGPHATSGGTPVLEHPRLRINVVSARSNPEASSDSIGEEDVHP